MHQKAEQVSLTGSDPVGILYFDGKRYLRGIKPDKVEEVKEMFQSGFITELFKKKLIPKTIILSKVEIPEELKGYKLVLEHKAISPILYPREWSFEMVKASAISFISICRTAFSYQYYCKDCHLFNFVFDGMNPLWVDLGSFTKSERKCFPFSLHSFKVSILFPLKIWSNGDEFIGSHMLSQPLGAPEESILLYKFPVARISYFFQKYLPIILRLIDNMKTREPFFVNPILDNLEKKIKKIKYKKSSRWNDYHNEYLNNKNDIISDKRFERIINILKKYSPKSILELAGNAGVLSELILKRIGMDRIICTDYDFLAVDLMFNRLRKMGSSNLFCAKLDFMVSEHSSAEIESTQRFQSDCVLALAVTHHLVLTQGYSFDLVFKEIKEYSRKYVFIEFMPLGLWNGKTAPELPLWYSQDEFQKNFNLYFETLEVEQIEENRVLFVGQVRD